MPKNRSSQISLVDTLFYHCISRCVRRSYLCGNDKFTGKSFEHRKVWVEDRLLNLTSVFAIDVCAYAVMSNHVHVVLHVNETQAEGWSIRKVLTQWHKLHKGTFLTRKFLANETLSDVELISVKDSAEIYRKRLFDISWFMRNLNEYIARAANKEDECTGRFWEGRFKSQALLDDSAVLTCMAYVDLNPIRAKLTDTLDGSLHTSIFRRRNALRLGLFQPSDLMPFKQNKVKADKSELPFSLNDYCLLVERTALMTQEDCSAPKTVLHLPVIDQLGMGCRCWLQMVSNIEQLFCYAIGSGSAMKRFKQHKNLKRLRGMLQAKRLLKSA